MKGRLEELQTNRINKCNMQTMYADGEGFYIYMWTEDSGLLGEIQGGFRIGRCLCSRG